MNEEIFREILPQEYIKRFQNNHLRNDGRQFFEKRQIQINLESTNLQNPYILVRIGNTLMTSTFQVKLEEIKPDILMNIQEKQVKIKLDLGYFQESEMTNLEKKKIESYYQEYLEQILNENYPDLASALNCEQQAKNHQWKVQINISVLNNDGNIFDSLILGTQFIVFNITLPKIQLQLENTALQVEDAKKQKFTINEKDRKRINLKKDNFLLPKTFCQISQDCLVLDPIEYEEKNALFQLSILLPIFQDTSKQNGEYNVIFHKFGSQIDISLDIIKQVYDLSIQKIEQQQQTIKNILEGQSIGTQKI